MYTDDLINLTIVLDTGETREYIMLPEVRDEPDVSGRAPGDAS